MKLEDNFKVAIVGRPNVGKSSLFNRIVGKRIAIVDSVAGITRDRIFSTVVLKNKTFDLIDTGGFFEGTDNFLEEKLLDQIEEALKESDLIIQVFDVLCGIHPMDKQIFKNLKHLNKPVIYVVNKVDNQNLAAQAYDFMTLGFKDICPVSAQHGNGINDLKKLISENVQESEVLQSKRFNISIVGKPNVGKSSLANKVLNCNRSIVSPIPGTTRDSVAIDFQHKDMPFSFIDTAGLTRRAKVKEAVDSYSIMRAKEAIERSDMVVFIVDAEKGIESQDMRIARMINDYGKCSLIVVNKWDLVKEVRQEHFIKFIRNKMPYISFAPILFTSVKTGRNIKKVMDLVTYLLENVYKTIPTSVLNKVIGDSCMKALPPIVSGKRLKVYYSTQVSKAPPTFTLFVNSKKCVVNHYVRYLEHQLRTVFEFEGTPIRFKIKEKEKNQRGK